MSICDVIVRNCAIGDCRSPAVCEQVNAASRTIAIRTHRGIARYCTAGNRRGSPWSRLDTNAAAFTCEAKAEH